MNAQELSRRYGMKPHEENGQYIERHYEYTGEGRAPSGQIYYYVAAGERTAFHVIDCDEYFCWHAGDPLELWLVDEQGKLTIRMLGVENGCEPVWRMRKGIIFGGINRGAEGSFVSCITVPRFTYKGFRLVGQEEITALCPETAAFFEEESDG